MDDTDDTELCSICRESLQHNGEDWQDLCPTCADVVSQHLDNLGLTDEDLDRMVDFAKHLLRRVLPEQFKLRVPTYYANGYPDAVADGLLEEFGKPFAPVLVHRAEGLRILLGSHDLSDMDFPDIQIERRPNGWCIFLHPLPGGDASGYVYFVDGGESFVIPESGVTPAIVMRDTTAPFPEIDRKRRKL